MTNEIQFSRYERAKALILPEEMNKEHVVGLLGHIENSRLETCLGCPHGYKRKDAIGGGSLWETPRGYHLESEEYAKLRQDNYDYVYYNLNWIGINPEKIELYLFNEDGSISDKPYNVGIPRERNCIDTPNLIASVAKQLRKKYETKQEVMTGGNE